MRGGTYAPELSVVVPVYRTAWALPELARRIRAVAESMGLSHELIVVDDASPDDAREVATSLANEDPAVRPLPLAENVGQHRAVLAGLEESRGAWVVVMDGDLQDPPEAIPRLLARARQGFDAVFAARVGSYQSRGRMLTSRWFKRLISRVARVPAGSGMYFLASRRLVERIVPCSDPRPFVVALAGLSGLPVSSVPVERARRPRGGSAYTGRRRLGAGLSALAFALRRRRTAEGTPGSAPAVQGPALGAIASVAGLLALLRSLQASRGRAFDLGDEGFRYLLSRTWADGESLFDAFRLHYVPGQYAYFGSFLRGLGPEVANLRLAESILGGAAVVVLTVAVGRVARPALTALAGVAAALIAVPGHATVASALVLAFALDLAVRRLVGHRWVLGAAAVAGALAGWREDSAVLMLVVVAVAVVLRRRPRDFLLLVLPGALLGFAPWIAVFALHGETTDFLAHVARRMLFLVERLGEPTRPGWRFPERPFASLRATVQALFPVLAATPPVVYLGILAREGLHLRRGEGARWTVTAAAIVGCAYVPQYLWERPDLPHLRAHLHLLVAIAAVAAATWSPRLRRLAAAGFVVLVLLGVWFHFGSSGPPSVPYPCCEGRRIGARVVGPPPPWAGVAGSEGALLVLGWGPGWYVLEGARPPTRFLFTGERALDHAAAAELTGDLADPSVRWVLSQGGGTPYDAPLRVFDELYEPRESWQGWRLWVRSPAPRGAR